MMIQMVLIFIPAKSLIPASWYNCNFAQNENKETICWRNIIINKFKMEAIGFPTSCSPSSFFFIFISQFHHHKFHLEKPEINRTYNFKKQKWK